jgi:hypothetical protein
VRKVGESKEDQVQRLPAAAESRGRNEGRGSAAMATTGLVVRRAGTMLSMAEREREPREGVVQCVVNGQAASSRLDSV